MASGSISANFLTVEHLFIITGTGLRYDALTMFYVGTSGTLVGTRFIDLFAFNRLVDPSTLQYSLTSSLISSVATLNYGQISSFNYIVSSLNSTITELKI